MLPKVSGIPSSSTPKESVRQQNVGSKLITEDYLRLMLCKTQNINYKPWKNVWSPQNPHSAFGDFPKSHHVRSQTFTKHSPIHEDSHAHTTNSNFLIRSAI